VTILNAVRWVAQAREKVTPETIKICFRKAGILNGEFQIVAHVSEGDDEDLFVELELSEMETVLALLRNLLVVTLTYQYARIFSVTSGSRNF